MDLSPLATSNSNGALVPPRRFRAVSGTLRRVVKPDNVEYERKFAACQTKSAGLQYEAQVQRMLQDLWPHYEAEPAFEFYDDSGFRLARPDGLLQLHDRAVIFEIKRYHEPTAWWQLFRLYGPIVEAWSRKRVQLCEITRSYDPQIVWPGPIDVVEPLKLKSWVISNRALARACTNTGVYQWRK